MQATAQASKQPAARDRNLCGINAEPSSVQSAIDGSAAEVALQSMHRCRPGS